MSMTTAQFIKDAQGQKEAAEKRLLILLDDTSGDPEVESDIHDEREFIASQESRLQKLYTKLNAVQAPKMTEDKLREVLAGSGKTKVTDMMSYLAARYNGQYDNKVARATAKEMCDEMKNYGTNK